jgi:DNA-binding CsgD family transcriptional regulator
VPTCKVSDLLQDIVEEATATSWDTYPEVAGSSLQRIFRGSVVMFVSEDAGIARRRTFRVAGEGVPSWRPQVLGEVVSEHPMIRSYGVRGSSLTPRRMSDILSQRAFERTRTYQHLFRPTGMRYQMTIVTREISGKRGRTWVLQRDGRDFSDAELDTARRLQDLLVLLDSAAQRLAGHGSSSSAKVERGPAVDPSGGALDRLDVCGQDKAAAEVAMSPGLAATEPHVLTDREVQVLSLAADGLTAGAIGRVLGISSRTVSKHLDHVYGKLGSRGRLLAVRRAEMLGLLNPKSA